MTFNKCRPENEAEAEFANAPWNIQGDARGVIFGDCFVEFKKWFDSLTPEQHAKIRKNI